MEKGTIDFTGCEDYLDLHERIRIGLRLPEGYGGNWHAIWDSFFGITTVNEVLITGKNRASAQMQPYIDKFISVLSEFQEYCNTVPGWEFDYTVED